MIILIDFVKKNMYIYLIITLLSAFCSILSIFIPEKWKSKKIVWFLFIFIMCIFCSIITFQQSKLNRINEISKAANHLSERKDWDYSYDGYIEACLAFLEQNKDLYPDAYSRAKELYHSQMDYDKTGVRYYNNRELASQLDGLIKGIAVLNKEKIK